MGKAIASWFGLSGVVVCLVVSVLLVRVTKAPRTLALYFDISEPWSYLAAQAASRLVEAYPVELEFHVITPPAADVDPQPLLRAKHAVRDAQQLADYWDIDFPGKKEADAGSVRDVGSVLMRERPARDQLRAALELGAVLWANDKKALTKLLGIWGTESHGTVMPILNANYAELRKAGHYMGGMLSYGGEWYWGVDRLPYLEQALARDFGSDVAHVVSPRPEADRAPVKIAEVPEGKQAKPLVSEMWFSFRSPYSYLALEQIEGVLAPYQVPLELRPILPMVMRGAQLPNTKRMYIVRDAKREADRLNIPFGELCDPIGPAIDKLIAVAYWAHQRGTGLAFAKSAMRGIWSEARDMNDFVGRGGGGGRAGRPGAGAGGARGAPGAAAWANAAATDLAGYGLWGVPSFKCGDFVAWGQDRLPLLADRLRRNALA